MATVANLYINVGARMKPLVDGMKRGSKSVKKFRRSAMASFAGIGKNVATATLRIGKYLAIVGGAAMAATVAAFVATANAIDKVAKVSARLGIGVGQLQGLHLAAKLSGIETNTLDMALQRMTRRVAEAALGMGESQKALEELGLSAEDMAKKSPDEMLMDVANALQGVPSQADKVRLAFKLFDSEGVAMVQMLAQGEEGLRAFMDRANELGLGLSDRQAAAVEAFNDSMTILGATIKGVVQQAVVRIAPYLTAFTEQMSKGSANAELFGTIAAQAFKMAARGAAMVVDIGLGVVDVVSSIATAFTSFLQKIVEGFQKFLEFTGGVDRGLGIDFITADTFAPIEKFLEQSKRGQKQIRDFARTTSAQQFVENMFTKVALDAARAGDSIEGASVRSADGLAIMGEAMMEVAADADAMISKLEEQIATFGMSASAAELYALKQRGASDATVETIRALHEQLDGLEKQRDLLAEGERVFDSVQTPLEKYEREIRKLEELLDAGAINQETFTRAVAKAREGLDTAPDRATGATDSIQTAVGSVTLPGMQTMETTAEKSLAIERKTYDRLGDILDETRRGATAGALT